MEKKNTMLLTVIAVATLLVAVVGATFAYFSITATGNGETSATISAQKIGTVTISTVENNKTLKLSLTADDMALSNANTKYYATPNGTGDKKKDTKYDIANITYTGGEDGVSYDCPVDVEISASGSMVTPPSLLQEGWSSIDLYGDAVSLSTASGPGVTKDESSGKISVELAKALGDTAQGKKVTLKGKTKVTGGDETPKNILQAVVWLENKNVEQATIANKDLNVTIEVKPGTEACTLVTD